MKLSAHQIFYSLIGVTVILIVLAAWLAFHIEPDKFPDQNIESWKFIIEVLETILIGFLLVALGVLIPLLLRETKHSVERTEQARIHYSETKTAEHYLPSKLAVLSYSDAITFLESVHLHKHRADTYTELDDHLRFQNVSRKLWHDNLCVTFDGLLHLLEETIDDWDQLKPGERLERIRKVIHLEDLE